MALVQHHNRIGVSHRAQAVGDDQRGAVFQKQIQIRPNRLFRIRVQRVGRFVKNQNFRIAVQRPRDRDPLPLAAGQAHALFAHFRLVAQRHIAHKVLHAGEFCHFQDACHIRVFPPNGDVFRDAAAEQKRLLHDHAHLLPQPMRVEVSHVHPVEQYAALRRIEQPRHEFDQRGFARAAASHDGDFLPRFERQVDVVQHVGFIGSHAVPEKHFVENQAASHLLQTQAVPLLPRVFHLRVVHVIESVQGHARFLHLRPDPDQPHDGAHHIADQGIKRHQLPHGQIALDDQ